MADAGGQVVAGDLGPHGQGHQVVGPVPQFGGERRAAPSRRRAAASSGSFGARMSSPSGSSAYSGPGRQLVDGSAARPRSRSAARRPTATTVGCQGSRSPVVTTPVGAEAGGEPDHGARRCRGCAGCRARRRARVRGRAAPAVREVGLAGRAVRRGRPPRWDGGAAPGRAARAAGTSVSSASSVPVRSGASSAASARTAARSSVTATGTSAPKRSACLSAWKPSSSTLSAAGASGSRSAAVSRDATCVRSRS